MSFLLTVVLIAVVAFAGIKLVRHDARARPGAESHRPPSP
jgi:hypothetical protein